MTEAEYIAKLSWVEAHMNITRDDPQFDLFIRTVEEIERYEEANP